MYAVIQTGGKQYRVAEGDRIEVELLDGDDVFSTPSALEGAAVTARIGGEGEGRKIMGFSSQSKSNQRRHWGHRQHYSLIEITGISKKKS
jgi:large subunit ribosomal protein L21